MISAFRNSLEIGLQLEKSLQFFLRKMVKTCKLNENINSIMPSTPISSNLGLTPY